MKLKCCGKTRTTKFCPDCGKRLGDEHSLLLLLGHLESTAEGKRKTAVAARESAENSPENAAYHLRRADKEQRTADKWTAWADQLRALLETTTDKESTSKGSE